MPIPILFTYGAKFGPVVVFGLLSDEGIHPVRCLPTSRVYPFPEGAKPVPEQVETLMIGPLVHAFLDSHGLLQPLLLAMAEDMYKAFKVGDKQYTDTPQGRAAARKRVLRRLGLPENSRVQ